MADLEHVSVLFFPSQSLTKQLAVSESETSYLEMMFCALLSFLSPHFLFVFFCPRQELPISAVMGAPVPNLTCSFYFTCGMLCLIIQLAVMVTSFLFLNALLFKLLNIIFKMSLVKNTP